MPSHTPDKAPLSAPQARILQAALALFSERGSAGTSLQMIADAVGVTKAAVYHQYRTKDEILLATGRLIFDPLAEIVRRAAGEPSPKRRRRALVDDLIELAVDNRGLAAFLHQDPLMLRLFHEHAPFRRIMDQLNRLFLGAGDTPEARVTAALLITGIGGVVRHPLAAEVDDDTLRAQMQKLARRLLKELD